MFDLPTIQTINAIAAELTQRGLPERDALFIVTDVRRLDERNELLRAAKQRQLWWENGGLCGLAFIADEPAGTD